jgi:hypothetical protein
MFSRTKPGVQVYKHTQSVAATTWTVQHNFGEMPAIDIYISVNGIYQKAMPLSLEHTDLNTTVITWSAARTGMVNATAEQS